LLELENPEIWQDVEKSKKIQKQKFTLEKFVNAYDELVDNLHSCQELYVIAENENDEELRKDIIADIHSLQTQEKELSLLNMLSREMDAENAFLDIQSGSGGVDAQDWAEILMRMYLRWGDKHSYKATVTDLTNGDVAGIKNCTIKFEGEFAYGWLRTETGIHRLVRKSPFDSNNKRHTSFASAFVYPEISDDIEIDINPADLRIDTFRASGAGGQHINKTDSAVRITHIPTNISTQSQSDRSQHRNKDVAMQQMKAKLYEVELKKQLAEKDSLEQTKKNIGWGSQIRSYVLDKSHIKDLRTGIESSNTQAVLNGDLDLFIETSLKKGL